MFRKSDVISLDHSGADLTVRLLNDLISQIYYLSLQIDLDAPGIRQCCQVGWKPIEQIKATSNAHCSFSSQLTGWHGFATPCNDSFIVQKHRPYQG